MKRASNTYCKNCGSRMPQIPGFGRRGARLLPFIFITVLLTGCDFFRMKDQQNDEETLRQPISRVNDAYLYKDELTGIVSPGTSAADSASRVESYINSWIRKQLLIQEAARKININEAEVERKILDYRYSIIAYEYQT